MSGYVMVDDAVMEFATSRNGAGRKWWEDGRRLKVSCCSRDETRHSSI